MNQNDQPSPQSMLQNSVIESQAVHVAALKQQLGLAIQRIQELVGAAEAVAEGAKTGNTES